jgi:hypothetical protein
LENLHPHYRINFKTAGKYDKNEIVNQTIGKKNFFVEQTSKIEKII